ncbi:MAG: 1-(5-phosphoribosyl)-5-[(5-phosphoribosylamino)methylideneamino]imidazole-4-carboxamide isomerase [Gaiellaceae bacterium]
MLAQRAFTVYPAIDVLDGRVVRLEQGSRDRVIVEGGDPGAAAERFAAEGATWLHLIDLDGAFSGSPNLDLVAQAARVGVRVQVGGGYRSLELVAAALAAGAERVLVGTAALEETFLQDAAARFGAQLAVAIDARDGRVAVTGWTARASSTPRELAEGCAAAGVERLVVTATRRDGTLSGPDLALLEDVLQVGIPVVAAGGISSLADIRAVRELGCEGVVAGSAIWLGRFSLAEAASLQA